jgi:hypothetical protein
VLKVDLPTKWCAHCHCLDCQRAHGAGFVTWFGVVASAFRVIQGDEDLVVYASSAAARRSFCRRCGTTLLFQGDRWQDEVHVALACMRDPIDKPPQANAYWDRHPAWTHNVSALPKYGGEDGTQPIADESEEKPG